MLSNYLRPTWVLLVLLVAFVGCSHAEAGIVKGRVSGALGAWGGKFSQEGFGHHNDTSVLPAIGGMASAGLRIGFFTIDYSNSLGIVQKISGQTTPGDAVLILPFGLNLGVAFPFFPLDLYGGAEIGRFQFSNGTKNAYDGFFAKAGATFTFGLRHGFQIRTEIRKAFYSRDGGGTLPDSVTTRSVFYFIGVGYGLR